MRVFVHKKKATEETRAGKPGRAFSRHSHDRHYMLQLQKRIGNQGVLRLLGAGVLQPKVMIGQPGERYEQGQTERVPILSVHHKVARPVLQLEQAPPATYTQALRSLGNIPGIDPTLVRYLRAATWNRSTAIHRETDSGNQRIFNLHIRSEQLPQNVHGIFSPGTTSSGRNTMTFNMHLRLANPLPPLTVLTRILFHEGLHMLIYMERTRSTLQPGHGQNVEGYLTLVRGHQPFYRQAIHHLVQFMQSVSPGQTQPSGLNQLATVVLLGVVEEKYVHDQEQLHPRLQAPQRSNFEIAVNYLLIRLAERGYSPPPGPPNTHIGSAANRVMHLFDEIDRQPRQQNP